MVCRTPGCKQSVGKSLTEIGLESISARSRVFVLSFSKRLGSPSGLQRPLHAASGAGREACSQRAGAAEQVHHRQSGKTTSRFLLLFLKGTRGKERSGI